MHLKETYILKYIYGDNFHSKMNLNCKNKQDNGCAFENNHIHMIYNICKGKCLQLLELN